MVDETVLEAPVTESATPAEVVAETQATSTEGARDEKGRYSKPLPVRIEEVTRNWREEQREKEYWRGRAEAREKAEAAPKAEKPTPDKFDDYGAYVEALADWKANTIVDAKLTEREKANEQKRATTDRETKYRERLAKTREGITDYESVMEAAADMRVLDHVSDLIKESELGAKLLYHFAKNPALLDRLNSLPPQAAAREVGRIEAGLEATKEPTQAEESAIAPKKTTAAPAPAKPIGSGRSTSVNLEKASMDEFKAARKAEGARWAR